MSALRNLLVLGGVAGGVLGCRQILGIEDRSVACEAACADDGTRLRCTASGGRVAEPCPDGAPVCTAGRCVECVTAADCPAPESVCLEPSCVDDACDVVPVPAGEPGTDPSPGDCQGFECDGQGVATTTWDRYDTWDDSNACTADLCTESGPTSQTLDGAECAGGVCNGRLCVGDRISVAANLHHACLVAHDGVVFCWGANESGQLGDGTLENRSAPRQVPGIGTGGLGAAQQVSVGYAHSCALLEGGRVACWGNDLGGQVGDRQSTTAVTEPTLVEGVTARQIATGWGHSCALTEGGDVFCWGACVSGECGVPDVAGSMLLEPTRVEGVANVRAIAAKKLHTCALAGGDAYCWGENRYGQLGRGTSSLDPSPVPERVADVPPIVDLAVSWSTTCVVTTYLGSVWCWGDNQRGQLGVDPEPDTTEWEDSAVPVRVLDPDNPDGRLCMATQVFAGAGSHICAIGSWRGREPMCWGGSDFGEIPTDGSTTMFETIMPVRTAFDPDTSALALGENVVCSVVRSSGALPGVQCTGDNAFGETGTGAFDTQVGLPTSLAWPE